MRTAIPARWSARASVSPPMPAPTIAISIALTSARGREREFGPRRVAHAAVGQRHLAFGKDASRARRAFRGIELLVDRRDRLILRREHAVAADGIEHASAVEQRVHRWSQPT